MQNKSKTSLFQRVVSLLMAVCMTCALLVPFSSVTVTAAAPSTYTNITAGSSVSVRISSSSSSKYFKFVPAVSGTYKFYSSNRSGDPVGQLLDAGGQHLTSNDDGGSDGRNFSFTYQCTANTTYYIRAYLWSGSGSYTLNVQTVSTTPSTPSTPLTPSETIEIDTAGGTNYSLFNSGKSGSAQRYSSYGSYNYNEASHNNGGYDLYATMGSGSADVIQLGLPFVMEIAPEEQLSLSILAYDVDENSSYSGHKERDYVYLVNETTGQRTKVGSYLSGQDSTWNNTAMTLSPDLFTEGQRYHFELDVNCSAGCSSCWVVYVRSVNMIVNGASGPAPTPESGIAAADLEASISSSGRVSVSLTASAYAAQVYSLEYKALSSSHAAQYGGKEYSVTIPTTADSFDTAFSLESGAPRGTYEITVFIKDTSGNVIATRTATASYGYSAVSYNANGGSQNLPTDGTTYSEGDTVTVKFDYVPSMYGYTFLGWSTDRYATTPTYTESGNKTFTIGSGDVTLYAVWGLAVHNHDFVQTSRTEPGCTTYGQRTSTCSCGETKTELIEPTQHDYHITHTENATCSADGYIEFTCQNDGCGATKRQTLGKLGHAYGGDSECDRCGHTIAVHTHTYDSNTVPPTCTAMGYTEYTCSCGHSYRDAYVEPTRHDWNQGEITTAATCTSDGLITYTCRQCTATKTAVIAAGHQWSEEITAEKTCTTDGSKTKTCTVCGATEVETIPAGHSWDEGVETLAPACKTEGAKTCTCTVCGQTEEFAIPELGHTYVNGVCTRCGIRFIDDITPSTHPLYGMYFEIDDILSDYGPGLIDEYGLLLDYNSDANLEKVAVYLTQDGTMWRRCIAVKGTNIEYATYVPYLSYRSEIKYTGLNHDWINIFRLGENADGIWCYSNYATIGVNLQDAYGNLLLSLYDIGQAGAQTRIFDDLDEMIAWLKDECFEHTPGEWVVDEAPSCVAGSRHKECSVCHAVLETEELPPVSEHTPGEWVIDVAPTTTQTGSRHKECTVCDALLESETMPVLATLVIDHVSGEAGSTVRVTIDIRNNPGIMGALLTISYDPALTLIGAEAGRAWSTLALTKPSTFTNPCNFVWDGVNDADFRDGTVLVLTFALPTDAQMGAVYHVSASYTPGNIINAALESVDMEIQNGSITAINTVGDVNDDGVVDVLDVITLRRYLAGGYGAAIDEAAADMNGDGEITVADVVLLRRFLVG